MKVFLLRHAAAEFDGPDPDRALSPSGRQLVKELAAFTEGRRFYRFSRIWSSPYKRARQTAKAFAGKGKKAMEIELMDCLVPHGDPRDLVPLLRKSNDSVLIVGHNPHLSMLARILMGTDGNNSHQPFKKGALFVFKRDHFSGSGFTMAGYVTPDSLGLKS